MSAPAASPIAAGAAAAGPASSPSAVSEKSESRGFFSKLFGRSSKRDSKTPAAAPAALPAGVAQEAIDAQIVTRARHAHAAGAAAAAQTPAWREWRFPPSLAGDKLEGAWRAWSAAPHAAAATAATGATPASPPSGAAAAAGVPVSSSSPSASGRTHSAAETRALLSCLEEVSREWETERRRGSSAASASTRLHAAAAAAAAASARDPLSSLPLLRLPFHSAHGHPSSLMRRVAQDFTHHVSHTMPDELAAFIAAHQHSQPQPPSVSSSVDVDPPGSPVRSADQQLEQAPMFVLLQLIEHLLLFTNNRLILQHTDFFSSLVKLTQMLSGEYLTLPSPPVAPAAIVGASHQLAESAVSERSGPFFTSSLLLDYFHAMMQRCLSLVQLWMDDGQSWRRRDLYSLATDDLLALGAASAATAAAAGLGMAGAPPRPRGSDPTVAPAPLCIPLSPSDQSSLTDSALQLFMHLHPHLIQRLQSPAQMAAAAARAAAARPEAAPLPSPPLSLIPPHFPLPLYHSLLHVFGCLCHGQPTQQEIFLHHSLHRRLLELVGLKVLPEGDDESIAESAFATEGSAHLAVPGGSVQAGVATASADSSRSLRTDWFRTQLWSLEVLREMCFAQSALALEFVKNAGIERLLDALLWTFATFPAGRAATHTQVAAVEAMLHVRADAEQQEAHVEEALHRAAAATPGGWMRGVAAALLRPENNSRCGTVYGGADGRCDLPSTLLRSSPELLAMFNVLLSMCTMDLQADAAFHPFTAHAAAAAAPVPSGRGVSPVAVPASSSVRTPPASAATPSWSPIAGSSSPGGLGAAPPAGFNVSFLLLQMVLDLFNADIAPTPFNRAARAQICVVVAGGDEAAAAAPTGRVQLHLPVLQLHTLSFFHHLLLLKPTLLSFVRTYNVYHTLFSASFFFLAQPREPMSAGDDNAGSGAAAAHGEQVEGHASPVDLRKTGAASAAARHESLVSRLMRTSVLDCMAFFATLHAGTGTAAGSSVAAPAAELSYLLSLLHQRSSSPTLVQQLCTCIKHMWQHRRAECEAALQYLCWQAHLYAVHVPDAAATNTAAAARPTAAAAPPSASRPIDPFKIFSRLLTFFQQALPPSSPGSSAHLAFLSMLESILCCSLSAQLLALREHGFVWSCFAMVEAAESRRRRSGIRITIALVAAVGGSADTLAIIAAPPAALLRAMGHTVGPPDLARTPSTAQQQQQAAAAASRARSSSVEMDPSGPGGASSLYSQDDIQKVGRVLLTKFIELFPSHCTPSLSVLVDLTFGLQALLTRSTKLHQDLCRRRHIFVQLMHILSHLGNAQLVFEEWSPAAKAKRHNANGLPAITLASSAVHSQQQQQQQEEVEGAMAELSVAAALSPPLAALLSPAPLLHRGHGGGDSGSSAAGKEEGLMSPTEVDHEGVITLAAAGAATGAEVADADAAGQLGPRTQSTPFASRAQQQLAEQRVRSKASAPSAAAPATPSFGSSRPPLQRSISDSALRSSTLSSPSSASLHSPSLTLLLSLLRCLTLLLSNNLRSKEVFRKNIGNDLLAKLVHKVLLRELAPVQSQSQIQPPTTRKARRPQEQEGEDEGQLAQSDRRGLFSPVRQPQQPQSPPLAAGRAGGVGDRAAATASLRTEHALRAIYGEVFRALLEREWSAIAAFERGSAGSDSNGDADGDAAESEAGAGRAGGAPGSPGSGASPAPPLPLPNRAYLVTSHTSPALLELVLAQVAALQHSLLLPAQANEEEVAAKGFLTAAHSAASLRLALDHPGAELLAVFAPSSTARALRPSSSAPVIQVGGSGGHPLVAFMLLLPLSELEAAGPFEALLPRAREWGPIFHDYRDQKRLIASLGSVRADESDPAPVHGAGRILLRAAQLRYPRGLLTAVPAQPAAVANQAAMRFFATRHGFRPMGWLQVRPAAVAQPHSDRAPAVSPSPSPSASPAVANGFRAQVLQWSIDLEGGVGAAAGTVRALHATPPPPLQIVIARAEPFGTPEASSAHSADGAGDTAAQRGGSGVVSSGGGGGDSTCVWIQNPDIIPLLFSAQLFLLAPQSVQREVVSLFTRIVVPSPLNQSHCCKVLLIDLLLDLFPHLPPLTAHADELVSLQRAFLHLIQIVGTHSISVKQLKRFFALMRSTPIKVPAEWLRANVNQHLLQQQMQAAAAAAGGPSSPSLASKAAAAAAATIPPVDAQHSRESSASISLAPRTPSQTAVGDGGDSDPTLIEVQVRPWYGPLLLGAIEAMTVKSGPQDYWFLDGLSSGLSIPPLDRWPAKSGWAFSAWLRVESYEQPTMPEPVSSPAAMADCPEADDQARAVRSAAGSIGGGSAAQAAASGSHSYEPRLFHFSSSPTGPFIEAYFNSARRLTLAICLSANGPVQTATVDFECRAGQWYHVALSQNVASTFGSSDLSVFIDAVCVHTSCTLKYPAISKQLSFCFVGTNQASSPISSSGGGAAGGSGGLSSSAPPQPSSSAAPIHALFGQLGPFYFFDDVISPLQVGLMFALGPSYMFTFGPETISVGAHSFGHSFGGAAVDAALAHAGAAAGGSKGAAAGAAGKQLAGVHVGGGGVGVASPATAASLTASLAPHARNLSAKIFLAYNAKARDGHLFLDNTPRAKRGNTHATASSRKRGMHAVALAGTHQCSTRHVAHVLTCLGGVSVLFPLLAQLDQPIHRHCADDDDEDGSAVTAAMADLASSPVEEEREGMSAAGHSAEGSGEGDLSPPSSLPSSPQAYERVGRRLRSTATPGTVGGGSGSGSVGSLRSFSGGAHGELVYEVDRRFLVNFLHVLCVMLREEVNQSYMLSMHGFSVIGLQLELASPRHFTVKTVQALHKLVHGVRNNAQLFRHAFVAFFTNLKLWIYAKPPVQRYWLCMVQEFCSNYPSLLNYALALPSVNSLSPLLGKGTQHLLDRLRGVCWFHAHSQDADAGGAAAAPGSSRTFLLHPVTQQVIGMRPSAANLREIRAELLSTLHTTLSIPPIGVSLPDVRALVLFLQCCGGHAALAGAGGALGDEAQIEDVLWVLIQLLEKQSIVVLKYLSEIDDLSFMHSAAGAAAAITAVGANNASTPNHTSTIAPDGNVSPLPLAFGAAAATGTMGGRGGGGAGSGLLGGAAAASSSSGLSKYHSSTLRRAGMDIFLDLLYSTASTRVRALALRGLAKLLRSGSIVSSALQAELFLVVEYSLCGGLDGGRVVRPAAQPFLADLAMQGSVAAQAALQALPGPPRRRDWDESIYLALLSLMLGVHVDSSNIRDVRTTLLLEGATILHTSALAVLLKLCAFHSDQCAGGPALIETILQDVMFLLQHTDINIKLCMDHFGWQEWFVCIMHEKHVQAAVAAAAAAAAPAPAAAAPQPAASAASPPPVARAAMLSSFNAVASPGGVQPTAAAGGGAESAAVESLSSSFVSACPIAQSPGGPRLPALPSTPVPSGAETGAGSGAGVTSAAAPSPSPSASWRASPPPAAAALGSPFSPFSPPYSEHVQSSINAQSYATSLFEQLLLHALKKPNGWKHFDRLIVYLTFHLHPPAAVLSAAATSAAAAADAPPTSLLPRADIPVLSFLLPVLQDLTQLLRRESETISTIELGVLVDNMIRVLERTQDVLLERVAFHAHMHALHAQQREMEMEMEQAEGKEGADADQAGPRTAGPQLPPQPLHSVSVPPSLSECAHELRSVWPLVEAMLMINAWLSLFRPAHGAFKAAEQEREQARRGYISLLGSAAAGVVKNAAGAVTSATTATYRAIHDAFDMMNEPNVVTPPSAAAAAAAAAAKDEDAVAQDNEVLFAAQLINRITMCFHTPPSEEDEEEEEEAEEEDQAAAAAEGDPHSEGSAQRFRRSASVASRSSAASAATAPMLRLLFHGDAGARLCAILSFVTSRDRAYTAKLSSAMRSSVAHAATTAAVATAPIANANTHTHTGAVTGAAGAAVVAPSTPAHPAPVFLHGSPLSGAGPSAVGGGWPMPPTPLPHPTPAAAAALLGRRPLPHSVSMSMSASTSFAPMSPFARQASLLAEMGSGSTMPEPDALHHLYTLLCTLMHSAAAGRQRQMQLQQTRPSASSRADVLDGDDGGALCPLLLLLLVGTVRSLHIASIESLDDDAPSELGGGSSAPLAVQQPSAVFDAQIEGGPPRKNAVSSGSSNISGSGVNAPVGRLPPLHVGSSGLSASNPSAAFLPLLPALPEQCAVLSTPGDSSSCVASLLSAPEWTAVMSLSRALVVPVQSQSYGAHSGRVSSLHRLGRKVREQHLRVVLVDQMPLLVDSLALVAALSGRHAAAEAQRYGVMKRRRARMARRRMNTWMWMLRSLTNERGPWSQQSNGEAKEMTTTGAGTGTVALASAAASSSSSSVGPRRVYWKLDETENSSRMRMKLKINYHGHDHRQAAHDYVAPTAAPPRPPSSRQLAITAGGTEGETSGDADEASSTALTIGGTATGGSAEEDMFAAAILFSKSAMGVLSPQLGRDGRPSVLAASSGGGAPVEEEDWDRLEAKDKDNKPGADKGKSSGVSAAVALAAAQSLTVVDVDADLITFRARVPGRFMMTATHLFFEARDESALPAAAAAAAAEKRRKEALSRKRRGLPALSDAPLNHDRQWLLSHICALHFRRHQLRRNALELFFHDHTCAFFAFATEAARNSIHAKLLRLIRPFARAQQSRLLSGIVGTGGLVGVPSPLAHMSFVYAGSSGNYGPGGPWGGNAMDVLRKSGLVAAWRQRKITNYEYLIHLNTAAGRTYNDLTQYPVFPWVLADYSSSSLQLDDPSNSSGVFRDLTKPVGALNPQRLKMFIDRYHALDDPDMPQFLYGSHYSSIGTVLFYLLRLEPFTTAAVELQDGKFDHSDRLFHSIPATWEGVNTNPADVKELIPEFFYLPDMLRNQNGIDFGVKQKGERIGDVILPPWAHGSAEEFVRINRAALESEYVSLHLHHWIDLIFGFKQQGRAALDANNVFFHLTYEGAVDVDAIDDPVLKSSTISQIEFFGQTPSQLFTTPHPQRIPAAQHSENEIPTLFQQLRELQQKQNAANRGAIAPLSHSDLQRLSLQLYTVEQVTASAATENPLLFLALLPASDRLLTVGLDRGLALHKFKNTIQEYIPPFILEVERRKGAGAGTLAGLTMGAAGGAGPAALGSQTMKPQHVGLLSGSHSSNSSSSGSSAHHGSSGSGGGGGGLVSALSFMGGGKNSSSSGRRVGVHFTVGLNILPFFFCVSRDQRYLLSCGHWDCSFRVTGVDSDANVHSVSAHKDIVTCLALTDAGDFVVTGSKDTTVCVWQVADAVIDLQSHPHFANMNGGAAAAAATASAAAAGDLYLLEQPVHILYGHDDEVTCVACSSELDVVVSGSRDGTVMVHSLRTGRYTRTISPPEGGCIRWVGVSAQGIILTYSLLDLALHAYTINGVALGSCDTAERLYALRFSADGQFLVAGGDRKQLSVYDLCAPGGAPQLCHRLPATDSTIRSIELTNEEQHVLVGTATGKLYVYGLNADFLRTRFLKRLAHLGL